MIISLRQVFQGLIPSGSLCLPATLKLRERQRSKDAQKLWSRKETIYFRVIASNGTLRTAPAKIAAIRDWPLPKLRNTLNLLYIFSLIMVNLFPSPLIVQRH
jgi:hypothetical protein